MPSRIHATLTLSIEEHRYSTRELAELAGLAVEAVTELAHAGLLPLAAREEPLFGSHSLKVARRARRLMSGFELDQGGLLLALTLMQRIDALEQQLRELNCALPR